MNILIFNWRDIKNPRAGGSEIYFHELAKRWVRLNNHVTIICGGWKGCKKHEIADGVEIIRVGSMLSLYLMAPIAYFKLKKKPDIIIDVENGIPFFTPLFAKGKIKKILHIHHVHKDVWFKELGTIPAWIGWFLETKAMPIFYKNIPIVTLSKSSRDEIEKENLGKVAGIVNPGINFVKCKDFPKSRKPSILFLNRIKKYKGIDVLLRAIKKLNEQKIDFDAWIAGSGDASEIEKSRKYAKGNKLSNASFLGKISEEKKAELMQKAWIFVNPSFKEGWGIVNIEANYFGTAVLGSDVGGIKDSVIDGKTGFLFEYGNSNQLAEKIKKILQNKKLRKQMETHAVLWAEKFDWGSKADEYLKIIKSI